MEAKGRIVKFLRALLAICLIYRNLSSVGLVARSQGLFSLNWAMASGDAGVWYLSFHSPYGMP